MRSGHHGCLRIFAFHAAEVFQSSWTSWSSKIIAVGTVDSSQRSVGSLHASRYSSTYSGKPHTSRPGGSLTSRRSRMNASVSGETSSA